VSTNLLLVPVSQLLRQMSWPAESLQLVLQLVDLLPVLGALQVEGGRTDCPLRPVERAQLVVDEVDELRSSSQPRVQRRRQCGTWQSGSSSGTSVLTVTAREREICSSVASECTCAFVAVAV
jgi:hypothetical protein